MSNPIHMLAWALLVASLLPAVYWTVVWLRVRRAMAAVAPVRTGLRTSEPADGWPTVSIVVPAHNEQRVIDECAARLRAQTYPNLEIIFVGDRCDDRTVEILHRHAAEDRRVLVIENAACPDDWAGKCNAARLGAERARGQWLLFTDADTRFDPELVRAAVGLALQRELELLSLLGTLTTDHAFERIVQPVAGMNLMRMFPLDLVNRHGSGRVFANGQFMLFRREAYEAIGGHAAVKNDLLEDIAFARLMHAHGRRCGVVLAENMLVVSMYDTLAKFKDGWKRIFIEACKRKPGRLRKNGWRVLGNGIAAPLLQLACAFCAMVVAGRGEWGLAAAMLGIVFVGLLVQGITLARVYRLAGVSASAAWLYPVGCTIVGRLMLQGARDLEQRRPVRWGGREYVLQPR